MTPMLHLPRSVSCTSPSHATSTPRYVHDEARLRCPAHTITPSLSPRHPRPEMAHLMDTNTRTSARPPPAAAPCLPQHIPYWLGAQSVSWLFLFPAAPRLPVSTSRTVLLPSPSPPPLRHQAHPPSTNRASQPCISSRSSRRQSHFVAGPGGFMFGFELSHR